MRTDWSAMYPRYSSEASRSASLASSPPASLMARNRSIIFCSSMTKPLISSLPGWNLNISWWTASMGGAPDAA